ncbi:response regulator [Spirosoma sp. HMF4905]|uniref:Response regulator n=1 Tax=Spirosoma arboris TaxID=2682092 RepID=A0A7K1S8K7_9BACT|nr:response regulator [Spirosoma arboris]MVM29936.1 response regulator [Spirosoma arboris]
MNPKLPVWIVEDDEDDQYIIKLAFESIVPPINVKLLTDGDQLVPTLKRTSVLPRLVLLDLNMQRQNGFETLKEVRAIPTFQSLPIVIFTTSTDSSDLVKSMQLGASGFVTKSSNQLELMSTVKSFAATWGLLE